MESLCLVCDVSDAAVKSEGIQLLWYRWYYPPRPDREKEVHRSPGKIASLSQWHPFGRPLRLLRWPNWPKATRNPARLSSAYDDTMRAPIEVSPNLLTYLCVVWRVSSIAALQKLTPQFWSCARTISSPFIQIRHVSSRHPESRFWEVILLVS